MIHLKKILFSLLTIVLMLGIPTLAVADSYGTDIAQQSAKILPKTIGGASNVQQLIGVVISMVLGFLGIVFFLLVFYAGLNWMIARGDEGKIEDSKKTIEAAVIGLVIVMAAYAITRAVFTTLGAGGTT